VQPIYFHSCHGYAEVVVNTGLLAMLEADVPEDPSAITDFDLWIHQAICPIADLIEDGAETFNRV